MTFKAFAHKTNPRIINNNNNNTKPNSQLNQKFPPGTRVRHIGQTRNGIGSIASEEEIDRFWGQGKYIKHIHDISNTWVTWPNSPCPYRYNPAYIEKAY